MPAIAANYTNPANWHHSLTAERVLAAVDRRHSSLDNPGFCIACGEEAGGCEPDAREYECESCGEMQVYGANELMFQLPATEHKAKGVYGEWCRRPEACAGKGYCPLDPTCAD